MLESVIPESWEAEQEARKQATQKNLTDEGSESNSGTKRSENDVPTNEIIVNRQIKEVVRDVSAKLRALELGGHPVIYSRGDGLLSISQVYTRAWLQLHACLP